MLPSVRLFVFLCFCCAPLCVWVGPALLSGCVALGGSPPCQLLLPLPRGWSRAAPWPSCYAGTSLWVSGCSCDGSVALLRFGSVVVLCCPSVICLMAAKAI